MITITFLLSGDEYRAFLKGESVSFTSPTSVIDHRMVYVTASIDEVEIVKTGTLDVVRMK